MTRTPGPRKGKPEFPAPQDHPTFLKMWNALIGEVSKRKNFKPGHLAQLEILCELYVEKETLQEIIDVSGYTYDSEVGRGGGTITRTRPEVDQLNRVRAEIRNYSKMLGLLLVKDTDFGNKGGGSGGEENWD